MKLKCFILLFIAALTLNAQEKKESLNLNKLIELENTGYVIATANHHSKLESSNAILFFVNTCTGSVNELAIPPDYVVTEIEHIRIDSLGINKVLILLQKRLEGNTFKFQILNKLLVSSIDGMEITDLTPEPIWIGSRNLNRSSGIMTFLCNKNDRKKGKDKPEMLKDKICLYNLKEMKYIPIDFNSIF